MGLGDHPKTFLLKALCCQPPPSWVKVGGWVVETCRWLCGDVQAAMQWWPIRLCCHLQGLGVLSISQSHCPFPIPVPYRSKIKQFFVSVRIILCPNDKYGKHTFVFACNYAAPQVLSWVPSVLARIQSFLAVVLKTRFFNILVAISKHFLSLTWRRPLGIPHQRSRIPS